MDNKEELLKYAVANGMIDLSYVQEQIEMIQRKELLENTHLKYGKVKMVSGERISKKKAMKASCII